MLLLHWAHGDECFGSCARQGNLLTKKIDSRAVFFPSLRSEREVLSWSILASKSLLVRVASFAQSAPYPRLAKATEAIVDGTALPPAVCSSWVRQKL